ncbi:MAG: flagellar protein FlaG [Pseudomonadota bacterium]|jgi:flagellar protein FlaG
MAIQPISGAVAGAADAMVSAQRPVDVPVRPEAERVQAPEPVRQAAAVDAQTLRESVRQVNEFIRPMQSNLQFTVDADVQKTVVKVVDSETREVIRQIPSDEMLAIARALDRLQGLLVKQRA